MKVKVIGAKAPVSIYWLQVDCLQLEGNLVVVFVVVVDVVVVQKLI